MSARSEEREILRAHAALAAVQLCFGLFPVVGKVAFRPGGFSPLALGAWRMAFGALALGTLASCVHGREAFALRGDLARLLVASVLGVTANMLLYLVGLSRSSANEATLVMCLIPVFTFTIAVLAGQERLRAGRALGVLVALGGASALLWAQQPEIARAHLFGNGLMVLNALCYAGYFVWTRPLVQRHPPLVVTAWVFALSVPAAVVIALFEPVWPAQPTREALAALAFVLVLPTVVAYLFNLYALERLPASTAAVYIYAQLAVTLGASAVILGEWPTRGVLVAVALVFLGIWLVARPRVPSLGAIHGESPRP